ATREQQLAAARQEMRDTGSNDLFDALAGQATAAAPVAEPAAAASAQPASQAQPEIRRIEALAPLAAAPAPPATAQAAIPIQAAAAPVRPEPAAVQEQALVAPPTGIAPASEVTQEVTLRRPVTA